MQEKKNSLNLSQPIFLSAAIILFAALYIVLSVNNRPANDDFEFLNLVRDYGWWNGMVVYWKAWNTRWLALLFLNTVLVVYNSLHSFFLYHIFTLVLLEVSLYRFVKNLMAKLGIRYLSNRNIFLFSSFLLISFFFCSFDIAESFLWINDNQMYLWSVIFILLGFSEIIKIEFNHASYIIAALSFFYIGGAFESYAVVVLLLLVTILIYEFFNKPERNRKRINLLVISILFLVVSFSIEIIGEGWRNRHSILGTPTLLSALFITAKAFVKMFIYYIPLKIHWLILFSLAWMGIGAQLKTNINFKKYFFFKLIISFSVAAFVLLLPSCYLLRETPPFRTWTLICFLLAFSIAVAGFALGQKISQQKTIIYFSSAAFFFIVFLLTKTLIEQKKITTEYDVAYDARVKILEYAKLNNQQGVIEFEPLPPSGILYSAEITTDTNDYRNRHVKDYFKLKCVVKTKPSHE